MSSVKNRRSPSAAVPYSLHRSLSRDVAPTENITLVLADHKNFLPVGPSSAALENTHSPKMPQSVLEIGSWQTQRYFQMVHALPPSEMISKFTQTAPASVQEAIRTTILELFGAIPTFSLDVSMTTTSGKLANLLFQMQITGYMFKNAEYRMTLTRSLKGMPRIPSSAAIRSTDGSAAVALVGPGPSCAPLLPTIGQGSIDDDVQNLTCTLREEVQALRQELSILQEQRQSELSANLMTYIKALPDRDLQHLTENISDDVLKTFQLLILALLEEQSEESGQTSTPDMVTVHNISALAQMCLWHIVTGYRLREFEVLETGRGVD